MNSPCVAMTNSISDLKPWSFYPGSNTYTNSHNFNNFDSFGETGHQNLIHAPTMASDSFQSTNKSNFRPNSDEYSISSSTVDIKADLDSKNLATFISSMIDTTTNEFPDDTWSNSATPDTFTYSSSEDINSDDSHVAQNPAPILRDRLTKTATDFITNSSYWQDYQQSHEPSQKIPSEPSLPGHFQQCGQPQQISQQSSQHSPFPECRQFPHHQFQPFNQTQQCTLPQHSQIQPYNQIPQYCQIQQRNMFQQQKPYPYATNTNYFVPMLPCYKAMHQQGVGLRMGGMVSPMVSASRPSLPVTTPVPSSTAASSPSHISSTGGSIFSLPSRKNAVSRVKTNRSLPSNKDGDNTIYHKCPLCLRPFKNKSNIKTHIRTHTKEKPYVCQICNKAFCQKAHLRKHVFTHQRQKN